jgi:Holliday junction resolvase RusA-like endonuclease
MTEIRWPVVIALAGPARGKGAGRAAAAPNGARVFTDQRTRSYEAQLRYAGQQVMAEAPPTDLPLCVRITAFLPIPASWSRKRRAQAELGKIRPAVKPDCNNLSKALDALNGVVWNDDRQIVDETVSKLYSYLPELRIEIEPAL